MQELRWRWSFSLRSRRWLISILLFLSSLKEGGGVMKREGRDDYRIRISCSRDKLLESWKKFLLSTIGSEDKKSESFRSLCFLLFCSTSDLLQEGIFQRSFYLSQAVMFSDVFKSSHPSYSYFAMLIHKSVVLCLLSGYDRCRSFMRRN